MLNTAILNLIFYGICQNVDFFQIWPHISGRAEVQGLIHVELHADIIPALYLITPPQQELAGVYQTCMQV